MIAIAVSYAQFRMISKQKECEICQHIFPKKMTLIALGFITPSAHHQPMIHVSIEQNTPAGIRVKFCTDYAMKCRSPLQYISVVCIQEVSQ